jgi:hypothetical protein
MLGGKSLEINRSEPPALLIAVSSFVMWALAWGSVRFDMGVLDDRLVSPDRSESRGMSTVLVLQIESAERLCPLFRSGVLRLDSAVEFGPV